MDIAIYTDYMVEGTLPYGGGAEIYALCLAKVLSKKNHVTIFSSKTQNDDVSFDDLFKFYNIDVNKNIDYGEALSIGWKPGRLKRENKLYELFSKTINEKYDLFINASDNTLWGFADEQTKTKSIKIIHFPMSYFEHETYVLYSLLYKNFYINSYDLFLANSNFTKVQAQHYNKIDAKILYPPISKQTITEKSFNKKENIIICPGRIVPDKKIVELAECFVKFNDKNKNWKFLVVGNVNPDDDNYLNQINHILKNTNYEIHCDVPAEKFDKLLEKSKIIWTAKGLNTNDALWMEHFGMALAEAMTKGCVPVVINKGGHKEIVAGESGFLWNDTKELLKYTNMLTSNDTLRKKMAKAAVKTSKKFLIDKFETNLYSYINSLF